MISRQLDRITLQQHIAIDEVAQALALTYLAYYNTEPMQPRVLEAYKRAWAFNTLQQFPRKENGTPGFNVVMWNLDGIKHLHIAIEGATSFSQLLTMSGPSAWWTTVPTLAWSLLTMFRGFAIDILGQLAADAVIGPKLVDRNWVITCAGHSLGAACADILAWMIKEASVNQRVRLIKFGSPRVGNRGYLAARERIIPTKSVYCSRDPIWFFPSGGSGALIGRVLFPLIVPADPAIDQVPFLIRRDLPTFSAGFNPQVNRHAMHYVAELAKGFPPRSEWYDHLINSYRIAMLTLCNQTRDMLQYRFRYLEHNNENRWQERWGPGLDVWDGLNVNPLGVVADAVPLSGEVEEQIVTLRPRQQAIVPGDAPLDNPPQAVAAPVGFPATPPATTVILPRRVFVRPRPPQ